MRVQFHTYPSCAGDRTWRDWNGPAGILPTQDEEPPDPPSQPVDHAAQPDDHTMDAPEADALPHSQFPYPAETQDAHQPTPQPREQPPHEESDVVMVKQSTCTTNTVQAQLQVGGEDNRLQLTSQGIACEQPAQKKRARSEVAGQKLQFGAPISMQINPLQHPKPGMPALVAEHLPAKPPNPTDPLDGGGRLEVPDVVPDLRSVMAAVERMNVTENPPLDSLYKERGMDEAGTHGMHDEGSQDMHGSDAQSDTISYEEEHMSDIEFGHDPHEHAVLEADVLEDHIIYGDALDDGDREQEVADCATQVGTSSGILTDGEADLVLRERGGMLREGEQGMPPADDDPQQPALGLVDDLSQRVWDVNQPERCPLNVLQMHNLLTEHRERHKATGPAMASMLAIMHACMPKVNHFPRTMHMVGKVGDTVVREVLGGPAYTSLDLCQDPKCSTIYVGEKSNLEKCPVCGLGRYKTLQNKKKAPIRVLRYMGVDAAVRVLLTSQSVCQALHSFPTLKMIDSGYHMLSSHLAHYLCRIFIPGFDTWDRRKQRTMALRFFLTGQVLTDEEWNHYEILVHQNPDNATKLIILEGGADSYSPNKYKTHSTWMQGFKVVNIDWREHAYSQGEIVTALSGAAVEGKAVQTVAQLDSKLLKKLEPPTAAYRKRHNLKGIQRPTQDQLEKCYMWVPSGGGDMVLSKVGVWVICVGFMGDAPMRTAMIKGLGTQAPRGCDRCGIVGHKGQVRKSVMWLGYKEPLTQELYHPDTGRYHCLVEAWATGKVVPGSKQKPLDGHPAPAKTTVLTRRQLELRDRWVESEFERLARENPSLPAASLRKRVDDLGKQLGSRGMCEFTRNGPSYWNIFHMRPAAPFHTTYYGPGLDWWEEWFKPRLKGPKVGRGDDPLVLPFTRPSDALHIVDARGRHRVGRSQPSCTIDNALNPGRPMRMSDYQVLYEEMMPYLLHHLVAYSVPKPALFCGVMLRMAMMCFTRLLHVDAQIEYEEVLHYGTLCAFAFGATMEHFHTKPPLGERGLNQAFFTWKLHMLMHMEQQIKSRGHPCQSSDMFVERMMRQYASSFVKNRVTGDLEQAISKAHEDNHSSKATSIYLAKSNNEPPAGLQLVPTIQGVSDWMGKQLREGEQPAGRTKVRIQDTGELGEDTRCLGLGQPNSIFTKEGLDVLNSVGFCLFTQSKYNGTGEWPHIMGAQHHKESFRCAIQGCPLLDPLPFSGLKNNSVNKFGVYPTLCCWEQFCRYQLFLSREVISV